MEIGNNEFKAMCDYENNVLTYYIGPNETIKIKLNNHIFPLGYIDNRSYRVYDDFNYRLFKRCDYDDPRKITIEEFETNGEYTRVKTKTEQDDYFQYAFRDSKGKLSHFRYDYASPFNEHGFALIGKCGRLSWININFEYFSSREKKFISENYHINGGFYGFKTVSEFLGKNKKLSRLEWKEIITSNGWRTRKNCCCFLDNTGKLIEFKDYKNSSKMLDVDYASNFNDNGQAWQGNEALLLEEGVYIPLIELAIASKEELAKNAYKLIKRK